MCVPPYNLQVSFAICKTHAIVISHISVNGPIYLLLSSQDSTMKSLWKPPYCMLLSLPLSEPALGRSSFYNEFGTAMISWVGLTLPLGRVGQSTQAADIECPERVANFYLLCFYSHREEFGGIFCFLHQINLASLGSVLLGRRLLSCCFTSSRKNALSQSRP